MQHRGRHDPHRRLVESGFDLDALQADGRIVLERHPGHDPFRGEESNTTPKVLYDHWKLPARNMPTYRGGAVCFHQGYRESHAVLDLGDKNVPKLKFPEPWKKEALGRACAVTPWGRHFLRSPVRSIYFYDQQYLAIGGFSIGTLGAKDEWRELVTAFQALPAVKVRRCGLHGARDGAHRAGGRIHLGVCRELYRYGSAAVGKRYWPIAARCSDGARSGRLRRRIERDASVLRTTRLAWRAGRKHRVEPTSEAATGIMEDPKAPPEERYKALGQEGGYFDPDTDEKLSSEEGMKRARAMEHEGPDYKGPKAEIRHWVVAHVRFHT